MPAGSAAAIPKGRKVTLAVVGDVHSQWTAEDEAALASLGVDVAVFVGDVRCRLLLCGRCAAAHLPPRLASCMRYCRQLGVALCHSLPCSPQRTLCAA